jgi:hypothetical protein
MNTKNAKNGLLMVLLLMVLCAAPLTAIAEDTPQLGEPQQSERGVLRAAIESLTGDVYAEPSRWQPLSMGTMFSEGWNEPWVSPPNGEGGAPRQGWLNAADGVFYRLGVATFGYGNGAQGNGDQHTGGVTIYTPLSRRFELQSDIPFVVSTQSHTNFGDLKITPRLILTESTAVTQSFNLTIRTPTGDKDNGNSMGILTPNYQFWANWWKGLVLRGSLGMSIPYYHAGRGGARTSFAGNFAVGYYFTPHDRAPFGDLVGYISTNLSQATDQRGPKTTTVTLTPGFRTHLGKDWYLLGGVELPATSPKTFNYQILSGLMLVF